MCPNRVCIPFSGKELLRVYIWVVHVVFTSFAGPDLKYRFPLPARVSIYITTIMPPSYALLTAAQGPSQCQK